MTIPTHRRQLFERLYREYAKSYPTTQAGRKHVTDCTDCRADARAGYQQLLEADGSGKDITEQALMRLLPHNASTFNRERGAWCTFAPAITREVKSWFENAPHIKTDPSDWPRIARTLLGFVKRCVEQPVELDQACRELAAKPYMRGFQAGMLSPILNALRPDSFTLVNNKSKG